MKSLLHWKFIALLLIFSAVTSPLCAESEIDYVVEIKGVDRQDILETLRLLARTITHQDKRAASLIALQLRAEADVERLIQGLQLFAYYSPHIEVEIITGAPNRLIFNVETGPVFNLARFFLLPATCIPQFEKERALSKSELEEDEGEENIDLIELPRILPSPFDSYSDPNQFQQALHIQLNELGVTLGTPAFPSVILNAEDRLVCYLSQQGYPLSAIIKREVIADHETGEVTVILFLSTGPLAYFGHTKISGNHQVSSRYILNRIRWYYGQRYSPKAVELTSQELEGLGLFKSVEISTETETDASGFLPMEIAVTEGLHRSIGAGVSYDTQQGGGVLFEWENRNVGGRGDQVSLNSDILYKVQKGTLKYTRPDFFSKHRDFLVKLVCEHVDMTVFNETSIY
ncbi:MAG: hypothetical protein KDK40_02045, partial [Chlamydiia bacterium]|nr:hypothetical protein [Chlamydiia bacterium]